MVFYLSKNTAKKERKNKYGTIIAQLFLKPLPVNRYRGAKKRFVLYYNSMCIYNCITKAISSLIQSLMLFMYLILYTNSV